MTIWQRFKGMFGQRAKTFSAFQELGRYRSSFGGHRGDLFASDIVRSCVRALSEHTSKANVKVMRGKEPGDKNLQRLIQYRPNRYMNGKDFLAKSRILLELYNTVFIYIKKDDFGKVYELYPIPWARHEAYEMGGEIYIKFTFGNGETLVVPWEDLAVLRKDYNSSDLFGDDNSAINQSLEVLNVTNEGMMNAIKSTANLRGILKSTKAMLNDDDVREMQQRFVSDYMNIANTSGVASLDATLDFIPIEMKPQMANYKNIEELRNNIYRYFGVNEDVIMSRLSGDTWEAFYEARIEPFLLALGLELTNKCFSDRERGFDNEIIFESNRMQYMTTANKLALVQMVDRGALTPNEWREVMNLAPLPEGDEAIYWQNPKGE